MKIRWFTDEQLRRAEEVSLLDYARNKGFELRKKGKDYKIPGYGGLYISPNKNCWNWYSINKGGGIIQFLMEFENLTWAEAVKELLGDDYDNYTRVVYKPVKNKIQEFVLPEKNNTFKHIYAYLLNERGIDKKILNKLINDKYIYENIYGSCVFVGYDEYGVARCANIRGTSGNFKQDVYGSNKAYAFNIPGTSDTLNVFESAIDAISYMTLQSMIGIESIDHYQSLACVADTAALQYLDTHPFIKNVRLCQDNDEAGNISARLLGTTLQDKYNVIRHRPNLKDFNDDLLAKIRDRDTVNYIENVCSG